MKLPRCIPTLTIKSLDEAVVLERIIQKTSINVVELTLREGYCLEGIDLLLNNKNIHVGLGTVYHPDQLDGINTDKIDFIVSPGFSLELYEFTQHERILYIPGIETASEIIKAINNNLMLLKFFPAEQAGGILKLKSFREVFKDVRFMCTGGINLENYKNYLNEPNVSSVGGSFVLPRDFLNEDRVKEASNFLNTL
jgi:2-dehydro-3-deoxyphosphogluconate aldolase/(4S)-4-hydroxy-2-oxoglutarate aldolase